MDDTSSQPTNWFGFALVVGFIVILVGLVGLLLFNNQNKTKQKQSASTQIQAVSVAINKTGFLPQQLNIKKGTAVTWINNDSALHQIAADPHPLHKSIAGFTLSPVLNAGDTTSFVFEKSGTFGVHDEKDPLNKSFQMKVVVQ